MVPTYGSPYGMMAAPMASPMGCVPIPCAMPTCPCVMRRNGLDVLMPSPVDAGVVPTRRNANVQSGVQQHGSNNQNAQASEIPR